MSPRSTVLLAVLVLTAGCALPGQSTPTTSPDPSTAADAGGTDGIDGWVADPATASNATLPPGVSDAGVDLRALLEAHEAGLDGTNFTLRVDVAADRSTAVTEYVSADRSRLLIRAEYGDRTTVEYVDGDTTYVRDRRGGETTYRTEPYDGDLDVAASPTGSRLIYQYATLTTYDLVGTVERDGERLAVLQATTADLRESVRENTSVETFRSQVLVDGDGVVRAFALRLRGQSHGQPVDFDVSVRVDDVGETRVSEPGWLDRAKE